jgi:flagellar L-ring protein precursor FlgH
MKVRTSRLAQAALIIIALAIITGSVAASDSKKKKKEKASATIITTAPAPVAPRPANGSLFSDVARNVDLLSDFKPRRVGDIVFVDVVEASAASVTSSGKNSRESGVLGGAIVGALSLPAAAAPKVDAVVGALGSHKFEGSGATTRKSSLVARIAARVVAVLPNGDLEIEAEKTVKINKEDEMLKLSGLVRTRDVMADNAVPSTSIADLRVQLNGKGVASAHNAAGWLTRFLEKITPF